MFPQIFGKYVLEREIAAGGMARVYLATLRGAVGFEKRLVVKQIRPELASDEAFVQRFIGEAKTAVGLSHPNIVAVYELGVEQGVYYIAMELCPGVTLSEVLGATGTLSAEEGAYVGVEICRALDYAHRRAGIVHRDVTPRNVLIDEEGAVRLIDFGIAAVASGDGKHEVFGSPGHMPPEQLAGQSLTPATDVFAVAALLTEAWTGRAPFRRENTRESRRALSEPVPALSSLRAELAPVSDLVARGLALDARDRPAEAEAFARPLRDFLRSADVGDVARRLGERVRQAAQRTRTDRAGAAPVTPSGEGTGRPSQPSAPSTLTRTFAARDEVSEWTRRISEPPAPSAAGTRKLSSLAPGSPAAVAEGPATRSLEPAQGQSGSTPATRSSSAPRTRRARGPQTVLLLAAGALIATAVLRGTQLMGAGSEASARLVVSSTAASSAPAAVPAPTLAASPPSAVPSVAKGPAPSAEPLRVPTQSRSAPPDPQPVTSGKPGPDSSAWRAANGAGVLRLTADPAARVSVHGAGLSRVLTTPVRELKLPAGAYTVRFESATYGSPVSTHVTLVEGALRSVHADFREAEPRISVR